jgi:hypothetical protein
VHDGIVQRVAEHRLVPGAAELHGEPHPLLATKLAGQRRLERRLRVFRREPGQEPELAEVDPEDRPLVICDDPRGAEHRAVTPEDDCEIH